MAIKYSQKVIEEFKRPENVGEIANANAVATEGSPACGDMITYNMVIDPETKIIRDIRFRSYGCASNIATASMASRLAKGKHIDEIKKLSPKTVTEELEGLPAIKIHCSVLAINGLKAAIRDWERKHGLVEEEGQEVTPQSVKQALRDVVNPETGLSLVKMNMVRHIEVDHGRVFVEIFVGETEEMFWENIEEETREHLERLPGVLDATVKLNEKQVVGD
ncbi:MAG: Iron-sulfur cluster assembly scaffold protein IscU [Calditrichaeota bacterium]|nr:Iron-sulfur cluster assembly scaffold protein IscU [Calditrichota bacterium]